MVKISSRSIEGDGDGIPAHFQVLNMKGLVDVAEEMNNPFQCFLPFNKRDVQIYNPRRVVRDCRDNAAFFRAISFIVDIAALWGRVQGIYVVEGRGEGSLGRVSVCVGPGCYICQVRGGCVVEESLGERFCGIADEALGDEGNRVVAQGAPRGDVGDEREGGEEEGFVWCHGRSDWEELERRWVEGGIGLAGCICTG